MNQKMTRDIRIYDDKPIKFYAIEQGVLLNNDPNYHLSLAYSNQPFSNTQLSKSGLNDKRCNIIELRIAACHDLNPSKWYIL